MIKSIVTDLVPFTLPSRYRYTVTVIDRRPPLQAVTIPLPTVTRRYRYSPLLVTVSNSNGRTVSNGQVTVCNLGRKTITLGNGGPKTVTGR
jgi:hypothetical protein